jgi:hypothetical protein
MLMHSPHVARLYTQFLEAENVPVLPWPANSPDYSVFQFPTISSNITQPLKRSGTTFQRPKSTV